MRLTRAATSIQIAALDHTWPLSEAVRVFEPFLRQLGIKVKAIGILNYTADAVNAYIAAGFNTTTGTPGAPAAPTIASFSTDSGTVGDHITNDNTLTLTGTAAANSTVKVFDGANQIGTTTANSSGAWSYTTAALPKGPTISRQETVAGNSRHRQPFA